MVKMTITKKNGDQYWADAFNSMDAAQEWIEEEKTRPYWDASFVINLQDDSAQVKAAEDAQDLIIKQASDLRIAAIAALKDAKGKSTLTAAEMKNVIVKIIEFLGV